MIDKKLMAKRFSLHAFHYDKYATIQWDMAQKLLSFCPSHLETKSSLLEIGCGTGRLTEKIAQRFPDSSILAIDIAEGMIKVAQQRCQGLPITFFCMDAEKLKTNQRFDLIISNATFQWIEDLPSFFQKLYNLLKPGGALLFSLFLSGTLSSLRHAYQEVSFLLYGTRKNIRGITLPTYHDIKQALENTFKEKPFLLKKEHLTPFYPDFHSLIHAFSKIGASGQYGEQASAVFLKHLKNFYEEHHRTPQGLPAEYEVLYVGIRRSTHEFLV